MNKLKFRSRKKDVSSSQEKAQIDRRESRLSFFADMLFVVLIYFILANIICLILLYSGTMNIGEIENDGGLAMDIAILIKENFNVIVSGLFGCFIALIPAYFIYKTNVLKNYLQLDAKHNTILTNVENHDNQVKEKCDAVTAALTGNINAVATKSAEIYTRIETTNEKLSVANATLTGGIQAIVAKNVGIYSKVDKIHEVTMLEEEKHKVARQNFTKDQQEIMDALGTMSTLGKELELLSAENAQIKDQLTVLQGDLHQEKQKTQTLCAQIKELEKGTKEMERSVENLKNRNNILADNLVTMTTERDNYKGERDESNKRIDQLLLSAMNSGPSRNERSRDDWER